MLAVSGKTAYAQQTVLSEITPSQPYAIWININDILLDYAEISSTPADVLEEMKWIEPDIFTGKKPKDVFLKVDAFGKMYSDFYGVEYTSHGDDAESLAERTVGVLRIGDEDISPGMVFIKSVVVLDAISQNYIKMSFGNKLLSPYYEIKHYENIKPDDVYGLVDMAYRRLQLMTDIKRVE